MAASSDSTPYKYKNRLQNNLTEAVSACEALEQD